MAKLIGSEIIAFALQLWTAPEVLRIENLPTKIDRQMADIYSVGILLQEMATECVPYPNNDRKDFILPVAGKLRHF